MSAAASPSSNPVAEWATRIGHVGPKIQQLFNDRQIWRSLPNFRQLSH